MPETLLAWYTRFLDDPRKVSARLSGKPVLLYEPAEAPEGEDDDSAEEYRFRTASGLSVTAVGGGEPIAVVIEKTKDNAFQRRVTIGRTANNDIVLDDASVSRFHAYLEEVSGRWQILDAGSRNGTVVAGKRLPPRTPGQLASGQKLRIGAVDLTFYSAEAFLALLKKRATE